MPIPADITATDPAKYVIDERYEPLIKTLDRRLDFTFTFPSIAAAIQTHLALPR